MTNFVSNPNLYTIQTTLLRLRASPLLCERDLEALANLAALNYAQQQAEQTPEESEPHREASADFVRSQSWLQAHSYPVHRDEDTGQWRLGAWIGRRDLE